MRASTRMVRILAPLVAVVTAVLISAGVVVLIGENPLEAFGAMAKYAWSIPSAVSIVNRATPLYFSALAVALGFKMGLFNIGVEGQYRLATLLAAYVGGVVTGLPPALHVLLVVLVAATVGGAWAGIAGVLKVTRGVHEVISTIMLNFIATGLAAYLLANHLRTPPVPGDLVVKTPEIVPGGRMPSLNPLLSALGIEPYGGANLQGFVVVAIVAGIAYYLLVWRTRFGYNLRASGLNPGAAEASGVDPRRMVVVTMLLSGAFAGLVGMAPLLGFFHRYTIDFPIGLGFIGIAVALLGRNHPAGIALAALLFGFMDRSAQILDLQDVPKEIVTIIQGVIILAVVVAYEVVRRLVQAREAEAAARATGELAEVPA